MIKSYDYSNLITREHELNCLRIIDNIFESGNWDKEIPNYQTFADLWKFPEFNIFTRTFLESCKKFSNKNITMMNSKLYTWCFKDSVKYSETNNHNKYVNLWHNHSPKFLSGIYYLSNPLNESTEFKDCVISEPKPFTWYIYPSHLDHRPPKTKSKEDRYTLASDVEIN